MRRKYSEKETARITEVLRTLFTEEAEPVVPNTQTPTQYNKEETRNNGGAEDGRK